MSNLQPELKQALLSNSHDEMNNCVSKFSEQERERFKGLWKICLKNDCWNSLRALLDNKIFDYSASIFFDKEFAVNKRLKKIEAHLIEVSAAGLNDLKLQELLRLLQALCVFRRYLSCKLVLSNECLIADYSSYRDHPLKLLYFAYGIVDINMHYSSVSDLKNHMRNKIIAESSRDVDSEIECALSAGFLNSKGAEFARYVEAIESDEVFCYTMYSTRFSVNICGTLEAKKEIEEACKETVKITRANRIAGI